jgi:uncharacterized protein YcbK (DUF882 family)
MKKSIRILFIVLIISLSYIVFICPPADDDVTKKLSLIGSELKKKGFKTRYIVISRKRYKWYNDLLKTAENSYHLKGKAIDIYVWDIDGDLRFTKKDIAILEKINSVVEKEHPELIGAFGTYTKKGGLDYFMVHIDTRGKKVRYDL